MPRPSPTVPLAAVVSVALACGDTTAATTGLTTSPPMTTTPQSTGADSSSTSGGSSTGGSTSTSGSGGGEDSAASASGTSSAGVSDVGQVPDFPGTPGCKGKIDFLFVISSNEEMAAKQVQLQEAFPAFVDILEADFADFDYHVMVVDAGRAAALYDCNGCYMCAWCGPGCTDFGGPADYPCDEILEECVEVEGAGVTIAANFEASNTRCLPADGPRFITKDDPDLEDTFECISKLGAGPKTPTAARVMVSALEPEILSKWGCNKGFLRSDALLAIIILQNGADGLSPGTPAEWYAAVLEAKKGNEDAVVTLVFSADLDDPAPKCEGPPFEPNPLRVFANTAKHGTFASSCEPSYVPFMQDMAGVILELCSIFIPPQ